MGDISSDFERCCVPSASRLEMSPVPGFTLAAVSQTWSPVQLRILEVTETNVSRGFLEYIEADSGLRVK